MAINNRRAGIASSLSKNPAPLVAVGIGICVAVAVGIILTGADPTVGLFLLPALALVALALRSPYWLVVIGLAQLAFIPIEGNLFGYYVPNALQFLAPLAVGAVLFQALRRRDHGVLRLRLPDVLIAAFGLWGLLGMYMNGIVRLKNYGNNVLFVMMWYYAVRLLRLDRRECLKLLFILLGATAIQSLLMLHESLSWGSPIYGTPSAREVLAGVATAIGPFAFNWDAGAYLCLWPPLAIYGIARASNVRWKLVWFAALILILGASSRTMERASLAAALISVAVCLLAPKLRRTTAAVLAVLAILYLPWSVSSFGGPLVTRFRETDQSRYARRIAGINFMKSSRWNPIYGAGWKNFRNLGGGSGTKEEIIAFGDQHTTVAGVASGSELHNVWLALAVEFGVVGTLIFIGIIVALGRRVLLLWRRARAEGGVDDGLVVAICASLLALALVGYYHNIYAFEESMCIFWAYYGLLIGHSDVFIESGQEATKVRR